MNESIADLQAAAELAKDEATQEAERAEHFEYATSLLRHYQRIEAQIEQLNQDFEGFIARCRYTELVVWP